MSLIKRNSPRRTRARKEQEKRVEVQSSTLGPVVKTIPKVDTDQQQVMLKEYSYKPEEPTQLNRSVPDKIPEKPTGIFNLYDLSFFCEERLYNILWLPQSKFQILNRDITLDSIQKRLSIYSEYTREVQVGSFQDIIHFYRGEVLIPEEFINISGFMRKFLDIDRVHVLYETGEILVRDTEYCNFWLDRTQRFFEPKEIPIDRPKLLDEEICLDCDLKCVVRHRQQMIN